jgi:hypothetical protein
MKEKIKIPEPVKREMSLYHVPEITESYKVFLKDLLKEAD